MSLANILHIDLTPSSTEPWGTPTKTFPRKVFVHSEQLVIVVKVSSLALNPSYQSLSKA